MKLKSFHVRMFKSILDSGMVRVSPLTVVVGKNESGKTSLLKALHKLNPAVKEPYRMRDEWPRGHRDGRDEAHVVCSAEFEVETRDVATLSKHGTIKAGDSVRVGRTYAGEFVVQSPEDAAPEFVTAVEATLPKFVYMDEYEVFKGTAKLDEVKQRAGSPTPEDKAILTLLSLAGLELDELVAGASGDVSERAYDLSDGSETITKKMASHWEQMAYEVELHADGMSFFTFVKAPGEQSRIKLEERSRGFQWFFSFDAKLLHETQGDLKNTVILLDEPGLHLHPDAQRNLLARLEEYSGVNSMIYTTHLPFMINLLEPDRIRVLADGDAGTSVSESLFDSSPEAKLTLQAALGMSGRLGMPLGDKNLIVEGVHDYWIVTALSDLVARSGKAGLPPDTVITAAGGANEATYLGTFMVGQGLAPVVLYDSDAEGRGACDRFVKNWLTRYRDNKAETALLGDVTGMQGSCAIEDIFDEAWYLDHVLAIYKKHLPESAKGTLDLSRGGLLADRVSAALDAHGISFNKGSVAKRICEALRGMKSVSDLPAESAERATKLIEVLRDRLDGPYRSSRPSEPVVETKPDAAAAIMKRSQSATAS